MENRIIQGDCRDLLAQLKDESIDCIITDPPYSGLNSKGKGNRFNQEDNLIEYDDMSERAFLLFIKPIFRELYRVAKKGAHFYCFTDWKQLRNMMDCIELSSFKLINIICWDKKHFGMGAGYRSQSEYVIVFSKGIANSFNLENIGNVISIKRLHKKEHPHQKPAELIDIFIRNSTSERDLILDPFVGCGTTCVVSQGLNRNSIGYELSEDYVKIAENQLSQKSLKPSPLTGDSK